MNKIVQISIDALKKFTLKAKTLYVTNTGTKTAAWGASFGRASIRLFKLLFILFHLSYMLPEVISIMCITHTQNILSLWYYSIENMDNYLY